ncbi:LysM peptidoglycan-binding domain-containing protein [Desulfovibrio sulfodismutans]|uniref:LysM peptidoglycan-binding domain-containing protein n=1 Tax=Desulfolutivibrio sulfodismutans TaxID=63561 RepID=A0A7K3NLJ2_9BACT|nr:LysM peptidoglycan-binding domain-containing protein [Desulfolutivibrio sulfodismutans]NDY57064.1 LysM peptidoglycan-binding domain-containing protein [Desulfolutivibrio sulfodismutans]QLA12494.1 LysM peptidoglycan-binding domain-containing protein [Desulfolutivibrio sulfodismutans DSM 3696]
MKSKTALAASVFFLLASGPSMSAVRVLPVGAPFPAIVIEQPKQEYVVKSGDTVAVIAKKFSVAPADLMKENKITDAKKLKVGQKLTISVPGKALGSAASDVGATQAAVPTPKAGEVKPYTPEGKPDAKADAKAKAEAKADKKAGTEPGTVQSPAAATPPVASSTASRHVGKTGIIENDTDVPKAIREEFQAYAKKWLDMSDELAVGTPTNKKIRQVGGKWECSYRVMLKDTMGSEVKRVYYDHTPYVGHITYQIISYRCEAPTKDAALKGPFEEKEESVREIFSYSGKDKAWR